MDNSPTVNLVTGELNLITSHCILYFVQWKCSCRQSICFKNRLDNYWKDMSFWSYAGSSFGFYVKKLQQHCYRYLVTTTSLSNEIGNFKVVLHLLTVPFQFDQSASWLYCLQVDYSLSWTVGKLTFIVKELTSWRVIMLLAFYPSMNIVCK